MKIPDPDGKLGEVSCPTSSFCMAAGQLGSSGVYRIFNGSTWGTTHVFDPQSDGIGSLDCTSSSFCAATDGELNALTYSTGTWRVQRIHKIGINLGPVSCGSPTFCVTGDLYGSAVTYDGTSWRVTRPDSSSGEPPSYSIVSISCPTAVECLAIDMGNDLVRDVHGVWSDLGHEPMPAGTGDLDCVTTAYCVAVGGASELAVYQGGKWSSPVVLNPRANYNLFFLSCPEKGFCAAVNSDGDAFVNALAAPKPVPTATVVKACAEGRPGTYKIRPSDARFVKQYLTCVLAENGVSEQGSGTERDCSGQTVSFAKELAPTVAGFVTAPHSDFNSGYINAKIKSVIQNLCLGGVFYPGVADTVPPSPTLAQLTNFAPPPGYFPANDPGRAVDVVVENGAWFHDGSGANIRFLVLIDAFSPSSEAPPVTTTGATTLPTPTARAQTTTASTAAAAAAHPLGGTVLAQSCPTSAQATEIVGEPMVTSGGVSANGSDRQLDCSFLPRGTSESRAGYAPISVGSGDLGGINGSGYTMRSFRAEEEQYSCARQGGAGCVDVQSTPALGPGTFSYEGTAGTGAVRIETCSAVIRDYGGTPLEISAKYQTHTGQTKPIAALCDWAVRIAALMEK